MIYYTIQLVLVEINILNLLRLVVVPIVYSLPLQNALEHGKQLYKLHISSSVWVKYHMLCSYGLQIVQF